MFGRHSILESGRSLSDEVLDEVEGEALVILEHPDRYAALTVVTARHALDTIRSLRDKRSQTPMLQGA